MTVRYALAESGKVTQFLFSVGTDADMATATFEAATRLFGLKADFPEQERNLVAWVVDEDGYVRSHLYVTWGGTVGLEILKP